MSEWKEYKLGDVAIFKNGKSRPTEEGTFPIYGGNGILGYTNQFNSENEVVVVGRVGAYCGSVYYENKQIWISDNALFALPKNRFDTKFLFYFLENLNLNQFAEGSSHPLLTQNLLNSIDVQITDDLEEQKSIASILSSLDDKIDLLHRQNQTLEALAETLFRQWFVEEAEEGWEEKQLSELMTITSSKRIFYSEYVSYGIPFYRSKEIIELRSSGSTNSELFISKERFIEIKKKFDVPKGGDILLTSVGTLGVPFRVRGNDEFYFKDGNLTWFKDFKEISSAIIYFWLLSRIGQEQIRSITIGSTQEAITIDGLKKLKLVLPPKDLLPKYEAEFESIHFKIESNQNQICTLTRLRDTLLPKLMSGEMRVKEFGLLYTKQYD